FTKEHLARFTWASPTRTEVDTRSNGVGVSQSDWSRFVLHDEGACQCLCVRAHKVGHDEAGVLTGLASYDQKTAAAGGLPFNGIGCELKAHCVAGTSRKHGACGFWLKKIDLAG